MAKLTLNSALKKIRGGIDDWVYRRVGSKMVISPRPEASMAPPTEGQLAVRNAFRAAASYGRASLADPARRAVYDAVALAREQPVLSVAIGDFFNPPQVHVVDTSAYKGQVGDKIKVLASDDVEVMSVNIDIRETGGTLIEQGAATKISEEWIYTATTAVAPGHPVKITATATDRPGNTGQLGKDHTP